MSQNINIMTLLTGNVGKVRVASYETFFSAETPLVWRPDKPSGRPPEKSALSGPPHVRDLHDSESLPQVF